MKKSHVLTIMTVFSTIIIVSILVTILISSRNSYVFHQADITSIPLSTPIPPSRTADLQTVQNASASGSISCTTEDPSICQKNEEGKVLEYTVGCTGKIPSASIYICRKGRWEYLDWTNYSICHTCEGK